MKKKTIIWLTISILILAVILVAACSKASTPTPGTSTPMPVPGTSTPEMEVTPTPLATLENTTWVLQSYGQPGNLKSVLTDTEVTALFDSAKGQVAGSAGINRYFGAYKLDGTKLIVSGMGSTMMAGPQPMMDQETEFVMSLQAAESYKIEGDKLTITCAGKVLLFIKK